MARPPQRTISFQLLKVFLFSLALVGAVSLYCYYQVDAAVRTGRQHQAVGEVELALLQTELGLDRVQLSAGDAEAVAGLRRSLRAVQLSLVKLGLHQAHAAPYRTLVERGKAIGDALSPYLRAGEAPDQIDARRLRQQMAALGSALQALPVVPGLAADPWGRWLPSLGLSGLALAGLWLGLMLWRLNRGIAASLRTMTAAIHELATEKQDPARLELRATAVAEALGGARTALAELRALEEGLVGLLRSQGRTVKLAREYSARLQRRVKVLSHQAQHFSHRAQHDELTRLPNRRRFTEAVTAQLVEALPEQRPVTVIVVDLDLFKDANDTYGHAVGDQLLVEVARRLRGCLKKRDLAGRLGGDEFAVMLADMDDRRQLEGIARRLVALISKPYTIESHRVRVSCSLGIATAPGDGAAVATLLEAADQAMYRAKRQGRAGYWFCGDPEPTLPVAVEPKGGLIDAARLGSSERMRVACRLGLESCPLGAPFGACGDCRPAALACRRDLSPAGQRRRWAFGRLLEALQAEGVKAERAREAIRRTLKSLAADSVAGGEALWELVQCQPQEG